MKDTRKGKIITVKLGVGAMDKIPKCFETIYRMVKTPVDDKDNPDDDETFCLHTLQTVDVEGTVVIDGGRAVSINGDFEISLDVDAKNDTWRDKEEAIKEWEYLTNLQIKKAEKAEDKIKHILGALRMSKEDRQF
jgi:hypothetical protein